MPSGTLEVYLVNARGLEDQNWLTNMNPYVILTCRTQEKESSVASGGGTKPEWNETFLFTISGDVQEITLRIMDRDTFSSDDFVGEAKIPLHEVLREGEVAERAYNVVKCEKFCGEIKLSLIFTSESGSHERSDEGEYGGRSKSHNAYGGYDEDEPRKSRGDSNEEEYGGRRNSHGDSYEEEYGGRRNSRDNSRGSDDDDYDYGSRRRSGGGRRGNDEDNYGGYRESRDNDY